jgi:pSer/pThr/pTyr-binding forkhead associated (FHA) protein
MSYSKPPWAHTPSASWKLLEIKSGVQAAAHSLSQDCTVLGRAVDLVDVALPHESISRIHARIAFDGLGTPWLRDLQSTHGVTVNKKPLPVAATGKDESNSTKAGARGVVIYPGDIIQFGASTRLYVVEGPDEFARGAIRKVIPAAAAIHVEPVETHSTLSEGDHERQKELSDETVQDNLRKEWEKLKALRHKLENVQIESERIRDKGDVSDLTIGQQRQLERNGEKTSTLQTQIQERETELYRKVFAATPTTRAAVHEAVVEDEDEDDEFFDRTKHSDGQEFHLNKDGETEESLMQKFQEIRRQRLSVLGELDLAQDKVIDLEERLAAMPARGDDESFFVQNDLDIASDSYRKLETKKNVLDDNLQETVRLLKIVNPKLIIDLASGVVVEKSKQAPLPQQTSQVSPGTSDTVPEFHDDSPYQHRNRSPSPPPDKLISPARFIQDESATNGDETGARNEGFMPPPSKNRPRVLGPAGMPPPSSVSTAIGTLAAISSLTSTSKPSKSLSSSEKKRHHSPLEQTAGVQDEITSRPKVNDDAGDVEMKDVWKAPKDQDGSGITKLNAKFAGRY